MARKTAANPDAYYLDLRVRLSVGQSHPPEENRAMNSPAGAFNQQEILHFIYQVKQDRRKKQ